MSALEKVAYLKGLADGAKLADTEEKEKFLKALLDTLEAMAETLAEHEDFHEQLNEYLEQLDEDVASLEEDVDEIFGADEDCCCGHDDEEFDEEEYAAVKCPFCEKEFYYEPESYEEDEDLLCPHCGKPFKRPDGEEE